MRGCHVKRPPGPICQLSDSAVALSSAAVPKPHAATAGAIDDAADMLGAGAPARRADADPGRPLLRSTSLPTARPARAPPSYDSHASQADGGHRCWAGTPPASDAHPGAAPYAGRALAGRLDCCSTMPIPLNESLHTSRVRREVRVPRVGTGHARGRNARGSPVAARSRWRVCLPTVGDARSLGGQLVGQPVGGQLVGPPESPIGLRRARWPNARLERARRVLLAARG